MPNNFFEEEIEPQCSAKEHLLIEADFYEDYLKLLDEIFKEEINNG